ncbi:hypothetical protein [Comamonas koreensis]|uniref:Tail fiber protein n=1 Tax=Comamonas koreensis TaxID=160825 RepID=A0AAW4XTA3_9BURK|nr:hypothetical protein [Comamonas koreensis]MCD2164278.1 hypothetical protein [Comamonas koreensis]
MPIVAVPPIRDLGTVPNNNMDEATFNVTAENFTTQMAPWGGDVKAVAESAKTNAEYSNQRANDSNTSAEAAAARLVDVQTAANGAFAAANYKGEWSTLTGALAVPATVTHLGRLWYLKLNLANVTTQAPALGSTYWGEVSRNDFTVLPCPAGTTNAADRGLYRMTAATSVLLLPAAPWHGMVVAAANVSGTLTPVISRNGKTICGDAENFTMNALGFQIVLQYDSLSGDWVGVPGLTAFTAAQPAIGTSNTWTASQNFTGGLNMNGNPIVERGSNADGEYTRYADGTQECWKIQTVNTAIANSDGGGVLYSPVVNLGSFARAFSPQAPAVTLTVSGGAGAFITSSSTSQTTTSWGSYYLSSGASRAATNYYISCSASGRWF